MIEEKVIVHNLDQAKAALTEARESERLVTLISPYAAGGYAGAGYFKHMVAQLQLDFAEVNFILDCGDTPGVVLAALRQGIKRIKFSGDRKYVQKLAVISRKYGAEIID